MISEQLELIRKEKNYYRDNFRRVVRFLFLLSAGILILTGFIVFRFFTLPAPYYYATSMSGQLTQLMPVPKGTGLIDRENS